MQTAGWFKQLIKYNYYNFLFKFYDLVNYQSWTISFSEIFKIALYSV